MNTNNGVILQDRNILDSPIMTFANAFTVYMYLKLKANWKEGSFYFGFQKITLTEGQAFIRQAHVAKELKLPAGSIKRILLLLQSEGLICINKTTNKYTVITINNYHVDFEKYKQNANKTKTKLKQNLSVLKNSNKLKSTPNNSNKILDKSNGDKSPAVEKKVYGNPDINELIEYLTSKVGMLDKSERFNRNQCSNLLKKVDKANKTKQQTNVEIIKQVIDVGVSSEFHSKNMTDFGYLYRNLTKIARESMTVNKKPLVGKIT